jgi:hypothetical protein
LLQGKALDTAEFAVHLDHVRDGNAHADYQDPIGWSHQDRLRRSNCKEANSAKDTADGSGTGAGWSVVVAVPSVLESWTQNS